MIWKILLSALIAGVILIGCWYILRKLLFPMPMEGLYTLTPEQDQMDLLEQQLRCCRWLRQTGLFRGKICVLMEQYPPQTQTALEMLMRQDLIDWVLTPSELADILINRTE